MKEHPDIVEFCHFPAYVRTRTAKPPVNKKRTRTLFHKESGSYDLGRHSYGSRNRGLSNSNGLRLLIFPQPLGGALKNQNAAPTTPPCFCRRQQSSSLHWADCLLCRLASSEPPCPSFAPPTTKILRHLSEDFCGGALFTAVEPENLISLGESQRTAPR